MKVTNKYGMPEVFRERMEALHNSHDRGEGAEYSVTELLKPPQVLALERRYELEVDCTHLVDAAIGTGFHRAMENPGLSTSEIRLSAVFAKIRISGQIDWLVGGVIFDFKTGKVAYANQESVHVKPEWEQQLNLYALLCECNGLTVKGANIIVAYKDHSEFKKYGKSYPECPAQVLSVRMWSHQERVDFAKGRIKLHESCKFLGDRGLPECTQEERWQSDPGYAVMKKGASRATRVCSTINEAFAAMPNTKDYFVERRESKPKRCCERFCPAIKVCHQARRGK